MGRVKRVEFVVIGEAEPLTLASGTELGLHRSEENLKRVSAAAEKLSGMVSDSICFALYRASHRSAKETAEELLTDPWVAAHVVKPPLHSMRDLEDIAVKGGQKELDFRIEMRRLARDTTGKTPAGKQPGVVLIGGGPVSLEQITELTPLELPSRVDTAEFVSVNRLIGSLED
ncbi:MAG TPA: hypothetical protein VD947_01575 [Patescibacteria group bacterium]|nr:hypothetical protein [Patescibacteria group bacterium]